MIIHRYLQPFGPALVEASDGAAALNALNNATQQGQLFALAIVDSHMPQMDGLSFVRAVREREDSRSLPVIMLTPHMGNSDIRQAYGLDLRDYLYKSISRQRLLKALAAALHPASSLTSVARISDDESQPSLRPLRILLVEDLEDNRAVVRLFLKDMPYIVEEAENGSIALRKFLNGTYDLVFMDLQMPVMDGLIATAAIRAWERGQQRNQTPIIALTANALKEDLNKSLAGTDLLYG